MTWLRDIHYAVYDGDDELVALFSYTQETEHLYMGASLKRGFRYRALTAKEYDLMMHFELAPVVGPEAYSDL